MENILQILAACMLGYVLLLSITVTAVLVIFALKSKRNVAVDTDDKEPALKSGDAKEKDEPRDPTCMHDEVLHQNNKVMKILIKELQEIKLMLNENVVPVFENCAMIEELELKLKEEIKNNAKLIARINDLEVEKAAPSAKSDGVESEKIKELEDLIEQKEAYYAEISDLEEKLRDGVCNAINSLIRTRGSNSVEFLTEQIENVIKVLADARGQSY